VEKNIDVNAGQNDELLLQGPSCNSALPGLLMSLELLLVLENKNFRRMVIFGFFDALGRRLK
jgi:hypothetical protein